MEILYVKKPSMIANVNYKEVIDELYITPRYQTMTMKTNNYKKL